MAFAIIVAAGRGERLGAGRPKALVPVAGRPLLAWSLEALLAVPALRRLVVVLPPGVGLPHDPREWGLGARAWASPAREAAAEPRGAVGPGRQHGSVDPGPQPRVVAAAGGQERAHSVRAGLLACGGGPEDEAVLVHDGARPLLTSSLVEACLEALAAGPDAVVAASPLTDTVKEAVGRDGRGPSAASDGAPRVARTLDRSRLWAVQTPQVFRRAALRDVLAGADASLAVATDEASLVEAAGGDVRLVIAPRTNLKVTEPDDLRLAELLLGDRGAGPA